MSFTPDQLAGRRTGIGGSEIAAIVGESRYGSGYAVWLSKTTDFTREINDDMRRGTIFEAAISQWYGEKNDVKEVNIIKPLVVIHGFVHPVYPWVFCNPDRFVLRETLTGSVRLLSIKSPRTFRGVDQFDAPLWGENGSSHVPLEYELQLQWEFLVLKALGQDLDLEMHLSAFADGELRTFKILADEEVQQNLLSVAGKWWRKHIDEGAPVLPDASDDAHAWIKRKHPRVTAPMREASAQEDVLLLRLRRIERALEEAEEEYKIVRRQIEDAVGPAGGITGPTGEVTWKSDKNNKRIFKTKWSQK